MARNTKEIKIFMAEVDKSANGAQSTEHQDNRFAQSAMFSRQWWLLLLLTVLFVGVTSSLGFWQLGRAHLREQIEAEQTSNAALPALSNSQLEELAQDRELLYRSLALEGTWLSQWSVYLNRPMNGQAGFWAMTPLRLDSGSVVLVQRGWAPRDPVLPNKAPTLKEASDRVQVSGQWISPPSRLMELGSGTSAPDTSFSQVRQNLDLAQYERETGLKIRAVMRQNSTADDGLSRDWPSLASRAQTNRGYAFQWFALSVVGLLLFFWFQVFRKRRTVTPSASS
jgi:surfeit locus 1 family protein